MQPQPEVLLDRLSASLSSALGDRLLSLAVHGSWVAGDFDPDRSDLDLVAILDRDPGPETLQTLAELHDRLATEFPAWDGRVEVDYVSPQAVRDVLADTGVSHLMARISPGEPIHLVEASRHYLLNWSSALEHDHALVGATPTALLPVINWSTVHQIVLEHLEQWPEWVSEARRPGTQAYAVLAVCRAAATLALGRQVSKRAGADYGVRFLPGHAPLIGWARDWWYGRGSDDDIDRFVEVVSFVRSVTPDIVATAALPR